MGCVHSTIDNQELVSRCKDRKNFMKQAVSARTNFAAAHSTYAAVLKSIGAALCDYGSGEVEPAPEEIHESLRSEMNSLPPPPPPPPLPRFLPSPIKIKRAISMPFMAMKFVRAASRKKSGGNVGGEDEGKEDVVGELSSVGKESDCQRTLENDDRLEGVAWDFFSRMENMQGSDDEEKDDRDGDEIYNVGGVDDADGVEPKTPEKVEEKAEADSDRTGDGRVGKAVGSNLMQVLNAVDDHFLKASADAREVSNMLDATRCRATSDHSAKIIHVITWNNSIQRVPNADVKDDFHAEECETHAVVLDKLSAWEEKLYEEVKQKELIKLEYQRKVTSLKKQKKREVGTESLEIAKEAISDLHTRYTVDMQSLDMTVSEVNQLRDAQLYPKLVGLVGEKAKMWGSMCTNHDNQLQIVANLKSLNTAHAVKETTKEHHARTCELWNVVQEWHSHFENLVIYEKQYVQILNRWLKINIIPIESSLKEKNLPPPGVQDPPIRALLQTWHDHLEKVPDELAKLAIVSFAAVIHNIILHQEEEIKLKEKCEVTRKDYFRKKQAFDEWYEKYIHRRDADETAPGILKDGTTKDPISEKQYAVEILRNRLEEEVEAHQRHCLHVREKSLMTLKTHMPELFRSMSDYAHAWAEAYENLRSVTQLQNPESSS